MDNDIQDRNPDIENDGIRVNDIGLETNPDNENRSTGHDNFETDRPFVTTEMMTE